MGVLEVYTESGEYAKATEYEKKPSFWSKTGSAIADKTGTVFGKFADAYTSGIAQKIFTTSSGGSGGGPQPVGYQPGQQPSTIYLSSPNGDTSRYAPAHYGGDLANRSGMLPGQYVNSAQNFERPEMLSRGIGFLASTNPLLLLLVGGAALATVYFLKR